MVRRGGLAAAAGYYGAASSWKAGRVMRAAVAAFFNGYHCFSPVAAMLALPTNLGMAAAEALFQLRVVSQRRKAGRLAPGVAGEAFSIAYIHALCVVLEIIVSCMFYRSCRRSEADELRELEPEEKGDLQA